ncbi:MAG: L-rhamnose mutarotase [Chloroflexi bacterium]|nr:L-rhamnose mutarotase [Chloroflexota bacterium]
MKTYGLTLQLRDDPELIAKYREHHQQVWPAVTARIREAGIHVMRIYLIGRRLFMYIEVDDGFDPATRFNWINEAPQSLEWDVLMRTMQEPAPEARPGGWWALMDQVFDLDWPSTEAPG